ncbi:MAG TPA: hypothetical protein VEA44_07190 [Caulobacter sp.]|nr:hypothetical protein [Caulobacter sp.]
MADEPRPNNREVENEDLRPAGDGKAPRPASEPPGSEGSSDSGRTATDPGSGESQHGQAALDDEARGAEETNGETVKGLAP